MKKSDKLTTLLTIAFFIYLAGILHIACSVEPTWLGVLILIGGAGLLALLLNEL